MKKILGVFFLFTCIFALLLELTNADPDRNWSWRSYVEFVTENIEPFPKAELTLSFDGNTSGIDRLVAFFEYLWGLISYPVEVVICLVRNIGVILMGFFPVVAKEIVGPSGGAIPGGLGAGEPSIWSAIFPSWLVRWFS